MFIKSLPPKDNSNFDWNYTRFGSVIPKVDLEIETLKELFVESPLTEEKLMAALRNDSRVIIETVNDREARESREKDEVEKTPEFKLEKKVIKEHKKDVMDKKINAFNEEKEEALKTETKEDDLIIAEKEKELMKEIQEVDNGKE